MQAVEEFLVDNRARYDDFRTPRANAFDVAALRQRKTREALRGSRHLRARNHGALAIAAATQMRGDRCQCGGCPRSRDYVLNPGSPDARRNPVCFARDESTQPFQFALTSRIMPEKFVGQTDRTQGQAHGIANVSALRDGQFAAAAA